jgi:hypothetical protein
MATGQCLDYTTLGVCRKKTCTYKHEPTFRAAPDKVKHFIDTMRPLVTSYLERSPRKKQKY